MLKVGPAFIPKWQKNFSCSHQNVCSTSCHIRIFLVQFAIFYKSENKIPGEQLTGIGILVSSLPMQFFMMLHRLRW